MSNKDYRIVPASTLYDVGMEMQKGFDEGYRISEGWPVQIGWIYEVKMEKDLEVAEKKGPGRPASNKQKEV